MFSTTWTNWQKKFAWRPTQIKDETLFFRWYYERVGTEHVTINNIRVDVPSFLNNVQRSRHLFDILAEE